MFLQRLLKKLSEVFSKGNIEYLVTNHFSEILIIIGSFGAFTVLFIILIFSFASKKPAESNKISLEQKSINENKEKNNVMQELLLSPDDFLIPSIKSFDVTSDFVDFLPKKKFEMPDMKIVVDNYQIILNNSIEESLKFNFEKRKK